MDTSKRKLSRNPAPESSSVLGHEQTITSAEDSSSTKATTARSFDDGPRYVIESEFARGGLGRILKAHDNRLDRSVAVKELVSSNPALRERFQREAAITARLQHPMIVPVYD